jgi:hypothetical protein
MTPDPVHPQPTRRSGHLYCFTSKHHGGGSASDARWAPDLTHNEEFAVFDDADSLDLSDDGGRLYGLLSLGGGKLRLLGTWFQQISEFPVASAGSPWHGYPVWPVSGTAPANRAGQNMRPAKVVLQKLEAAGLITKKQQKLLMKGDLA